jgi:hypothetical protein
MLLRLVSSLLLRRVEAVFRILIASKLVVIAIKPDPHKGRW